MNPPFDSPDPEESLRQKLIKALYRGEPNWPGLGGESAVKYFPFHPFHSLSFDQLTMSIISPLTLVASLQFDGMTRPHCARVLKEGGKTVE